MAILVEGENRTEKPVSAEQLISHPEIKIPWVLVELDKGVTTPPLYNPKTRIFEVKVKGGVVEEMPDNVTRASGEDWRYTIEGSQEIIYHVSTEGFVTIGTNPPPEPTGFKRYGFGARLTKGPSPMLEFFEARVPKNLFP